MIDDRIARCLLIVGGRHLGLERRQGSLELVKTEQPNRGLIKDDILGDDANCRCVLGRKRKTFRSYGVEVGVRRLRDVVRRGTFETVFAPFNIIVARQLKALSFLPLWP